MSDPTYREKEPANSQTGRCCLPAAACPVRRGRREALETPTGELTMKIEKRKMLEAAGFRIGTTADFLGLSAEEQAIVELRLAVGRQVRSRREKLRLSQHQLAARIRSSQSRV